MFIRLANNMKSHVNNFWPRCRGSYIDGESAKLVPPLWTTTW